MSPPPLAVAFDATPMLGTLTGVGLFCDGALQGLSARSDVRVSAFAVTWRRRRALPSRLPPGIGAVERSMPARPIQFCWRHSAWPPFEWMAGPVDVVHGTNFVVPPTRRAARVVTVHDLTLLRYPEICDPGSLAFLPVLRRSVAEGAWVHTHSRFVADEVVDELGVDPGRVRVVPPGVPEPWGSGRPHPVDLRGLPPVALPSDTARYILAVGTAEPRKDFPGLVLAFNRIAGDHPDVALVLAGPSGWDGGALDRAVESSPFRRRVVQTGYVDDEVLGGLLKGATALAFPSVYEGFGFPPLQAMAAGVPVVATAAGSVPEVVGDGALLVAPGEPDALAAALLRVLDDADERTALIGRGTARAAAFTWQSCAQGLVALYREAHQG